MFSFGRLPTALNKQTQNSNSDRFVTALALPRASEKVGRPPGRNPGLGITLYDED